MRIDFRKGFTFILLVALIAGLFLATPGRVQAATLMVNTTIDQNNTDPSHCSLREAVVAANTNISYGGCPPGTGTSDVIILSPGEYRLDLAGADEEGKKGDLDILQGVRISGSGPSTKITISVKDRIFHVKSLTPVTISNLMLTNGDSSDYIAGGGAILNDSGSDLTLAFLTITGNTAGATASGHVGGGVTNKTTATLTITSSTITGNTAYTGGGIYNGGQLTVLASLINSNIAYSIGGGIDSRPEANESATIINTTIAENIANEEGAGVIANGNLEMRGDTVVNNYKTEGIVLRSGSNLSIRNTIIARHSVNNCRITDATINSLGYNLEDHDTCHLKDEIPEYYDLVNTDPMFVLGNYGQIALEDNGGPTKTYRLLEGSPAVDWIPMGQSTCPDVVDQRLYGRGVDGDVSGEGGCDIGAFEVGGSIFFTQFPVTYR